MQLILRHKGGDYYRGIDPVDSYATKWTADINQAKRFTDRDELHAETWLNFANPSALDVIEVAVERGPDRRQQVRRT